MFELFPRIIGNENRMVFCREQVLETFQEWNKLGKSCTISLYSFEEWINNEPIEETVILDVYMIYGKEERLREIGDELNKEGSKGYLIDDGKDTFLLIENANEERISSLPDIKIERNVKKKIIWPNCMNNRTGRKCRILQRW